MENLKWGYAQSNSPELVYLPVIGKVDLFVPAKPYPVLMLFHNHTAKDFVVADYATGVKLASYKRKKDAREHMTEALSIMCFNGLNAKAKQGYPLPIVNQLS